MCVFALRWGERENDYVLDQMLDQEFAFKRISILLRQATTAVDLKSSIFKLNRLDITALQLQSTKQQTEVKWKFIFKCAIFQKLFNNSI